MYKIVIIVKPYSSRQQIYAALDCKKHNSEVIVLLKGIDYYPLFSVFPCLLDNTILLGAGLKSLVVLREKPEPPRDFSGYTKSTLRKYVMITTAKWLVIN